jgi:hypothetical protein
VDCARRWNGVRDQLQVVLALTSPIAASLEKSGRLCLTDRFDILSAECPRKLPKISGADQQNFLAARLVSSLHRSSCCFRACGHPATGAEHDPISFAVQNRIHLLD